MVILSGENQNLETAKAELEKCRSFRDYCERWEKSMIQLIQTYLPNVYKLGWSGQYGWGTAIYLTLYMTVISFIIGGFLGLVTGLLLVLTRPGGVIENRIVFQILIRLLPCSAPFPSLSCWPLLIH